MGGVAATPLFVTAGAIGGVGAALYVTQDKWKPAVKKLAKNTSEFCKGVWANGRRFLFG